MDLFFFILDFIKLKIQFNYFLSLFLFTLFLLIYNSISLPGNLIFMLSSGYFFGLYTGFIISILTLVFGSLIFFSFASYSIKKFSPKFINKYSSKLDIYISNSSIEYLIIFRMIPGPPLMLQNTILSLLSITKTKFILSSLIGFTPIVFVVVYFGHQINNFSNLKSYSISDIFSLKFLIVLALIILLLFFRIFYKKK